MASVKEKLTAEKESQIAALRAEMKANEERLQEQKAVERAVSASSEDKDVQVEINVGPMTFDMQVEAIVDMRNAESQTAADHEAKKSEEIQTLIDEAAMDQLVASASAVIKSKENSPADGEDAVDEPSSPTRRDFQTAASAFASMDVAAIANTNPKPVDQVSREVQTVLDKVETLDREAMTLSFYELKLVIEKELEEKYEARVKTIEASYQEKMDKIDEENRNIASVANRANENADLGVA